MDENSASEITQWLLSQGLGQFSGDFVANDIDLSLLTSLNEQDLKDLGLSIGHRRRFGRAVRQMAGKAPPARSRPSSSEELERRQITIMFCDMVGATSLSSRLDPEDLRAVMHQYYKACKAAILQHQGFIATYLGDGLLSYFGYPEAHEAAAEGAVRAGLSILESVRQVAVSDGTRLGVRIGIATGMAVVGDLIGEGASEMWAVIGQTPNLAARIQGLAEINTLWISESTRALIKGQFDCIDHGVQLLKGFDEPVHVWQVTAQTSKSSRFDALHPNPQQCIGRENELGALTGYWALSLQGHSKHVQIIAEAGFGKSRLLRALLDQIGTQAPHVLFMQCAYDRSAHPLHPLIAALRQEIALQAHDPALASLQRIQDWLGESATTENLALTANFFGLDPLSTASLSSLSAEQRKLRTFQIFVEVYKRRAHLRPVLVVVEDAHWIDSLTQSFLDSISREFQNNRIMLIVTARPEYLERFNGEGRLTLRLGRLALPHARQVIKNLCGELQLPLETIDQIVDRSEGIPLYLEELTKPVLDHWASGAQSELLPTLIPASLQDSLMSRLDRLGKSKEVAQFASCIGQTFSLQLLVKLMARPSAEVNDLLAQLLQADLIYREVLAQELRFTFKHALLQDLAYESLLRGKRRLLHQSIVEIIEADPEESKKYDPGLMAHHCRRGKLPEKEAFYLVEAGRAATRLVAVKEALALLERAESLLAELPPSPKVVADHARVILALMDTGRFVILPSRLIELAQKVRDRQDALGAASDLATEVALLFQQGRAHLYTSNYSQATEIFKQIIELGRSVNAMDIMMKPGSALTMTLNCQGYFAESVAFIHSKNIGYFREQKNLIDYLAGLGWCGHATCQQGQVNLGLQLNDLAIEESSKLGSAIYSASAYIWKSHSLLACRMHPQAVIAAQHGVELAKSCEVPYLVWHGLVMLSFAHARSGAFELATQQLQEARGTLRFFPQEQISLLDYPATIEAEIACFSDDFDAATMRAEQAIESAAQRQGIFTESLAHRALAVSLLRKGEDVARACRHAQRAFDLMNASGANAEYTFSVHLWAHALVETGHAALALPWQAIVKDCVKRFGFDVALCEHLGAQALAQHGAAGPEIIGT
jgi:class 3 adenylate cyclase/tetratricopeptide (TPR) repeat protein